MANLYNIKLLQITLEIYLEKLKKSLATFVEWYGWICCRYLLWTNLRAGDTMAGYLWQTVPSCYVAGGTGHVVISLINLEMIFYDFAKSKDR